MSNYLVYPPPPKTADGRPKKKPTARSAGQLDIRLPESETIHYEGGKRYALCSILGMYLRAISETKVITLSLLGTFPSVRGRYIFIWIQEKLRMV